MSELRHMRKCLAMLAKDIADVVGQNDHPDYCGLPQVDHDLKYWSRVYQYYGQTEFEKADVA
jgi:hypothetical protein